MKRYLIGICFFLIANSLWAQITNNYGTLIHTYDARTFNKGKIGVYNNLNFYSKASTLIDASDPSSEFRANNYWTVSDNLSFSYGIMEHFDASLGIRIYQDTNVKEDNNLPDDLFLTLRGGSFSFSDNHFHQAVIAGFRFATAKYHNYLWSEFSSGAALEYGIKWAVSYYSDNYLMEKDINLHFNLGYWNHNENGTDLYELTNGDQLSGSVNSSSIDIALAAVFPTQNFDFRFELTGMYYITNPDSFVYSNVSYTYFTPSVKYKVSKNISLDFGADFRLSSDDRDIPSWMRHPSKHLDLPKTYVPWKLNLGLNFAFGNLSENVSLKYKNTKEKEKAELMNKIHDEEQKSKKKQNEIINIRKVGDEVEKDIDELRKKLED